MTTQNDPERELPAQAIVDSILRHGPAHAVFVDSELRIAAATESFRELAQAETGDDFTGILDRFTVGGARTFFSDLAEGGDVDGRTLVMHVNGAGSGGRPYVFSWTAVRDAAGRCQGYWGMAREAEPAGGDEADSVALREQISALRAEGERRAREIVRLRRRVESQTQVDELTGLGNRQFIMDRLQTEVPRAIRYDEPLTLLLFDIDRLDAVNERYGQSVGDEVIRRLADTVREQVRSTDVVARFGGEEFMILCPHTDRASSHFLAERLRRRIAEISFSGQGEEFGVTISTGLLTVTSRTEFDVEAILHAVHEALQAAKHRGMNRVQLVETP